MSLVPSPVTGGQTAVVDQFDAAAIIYRYRADWDIDVRSYFDGMSKVPLFQCADTGYRFFYPQSLAGEADFYDVVWQAEIRRADSSEWRDDLQFALNRLRPGERVLDVGCANGVFVERAAQIAIAEGIDANRKGCQFAAERGLNVTCTTVGEHGRQFGSSYDTVVAFQVLEHVFDVSGFIQGLASLARPGGRIILSVPNNQPYYAGWAKYEPMNNPPHHIGLWNEQSLRAMARHFCLSVCEVEMTDRPSSFPVQTFRRAAHLARIPKNPSQVRGVEWLWIWAMAPMAVILSALDFVTRPSSRYAYLSIVLQK